VDASINETLQKSVPNVDTLFQSKAHSADSEFRAAKDQAVSADANWFLRCLFIQNDNKDRALAATLTQATGDLRLRGNSYTFVIQDKSR
jgi:hypothetical protein